MKHLTLTAASLAVLLATGCGKGSDRTSSRPTDPFEGHVQITPDNSLLIVQSLFNWTDALNEHASLFVTEYPNFYFGALDSSQQAIECDYRGHYTYIISDQDPAASQRTEGDSLEMSFSECRSDYGQYDGYVRRLVNLSNPPAEIGGTFEFDVALDYVDFAFTRARSRETENTPPSHTVNGQVSIVETRDSASTLERATCAGMEVEWHQHSGLIEKCVDALSEESYIRSTRTSYRTFGGTISRSDLDGPFHAVTITPLERQISPDREWLLQNGKIMVHGRSGSTLTIAPSSRDAESILISVDSDGNQIIEYEYVLPLFMVLRR